MGTHTQILPDEDRKGRISAMPQLNIKTIISCKYFHPVDRPACDEQEFKSFLTIKVFKLKIASFL